MFREAPAERGAPAQLRPETWRAPQRCASHAAHRRAHTRPRTRPPPARRRLPPTEASSHPPLPGRVWGCVCPPSRAPGRVKLVRWGPPGGPPSRTHSPARGASRITPARVLGAQGARPGGRTGQAGGGRGVGGSRPRASRVTLVSWRTDTVPGAVRVAASSGSLSFSLISVMVGAQGREHAEPRRASRCGGPAAGGRASLRGPGRPAPQAAAAAAAAAPRTPGKTRPDKASPHSRARAEKVPGRAGEGRGGPGAVGAGRPRGRGARVRRGRCSQPGAEGRGDAGLSGGREPWSGPGPAGSAAL